jgi:hypothetical protein
MPVILAVWEAEIRNHDPPNLTFSYNWDYRSKPLVPGWDRVLF